MRLPILRRYTAVGKADTLGRILVPVNYMGLAFAVGIGILYSEDATGGASTLQFTYDSMSNDDFYAVGISQTTTVITVTDTNLPNIGGNAVGDVVKLIGTGVAGVDGEWVVATTPTPTSYTLTSSVSQSVAPMNGKAAQFRLFNSTITSAANARAFGNLAAGAPAQSGPVTGVVLNVTALTAGSTYLSVLQGMGQ